MYIYFVLAFFATGALLGAVFSFLLLLFRFLTVGDGTIPYHNGWGR
jgi:hypothetical protein